MPIYEYECSKCGHQEEVWQKFSDKPLTKCELCNGKVRKLISQSTFHLKGTGWYVTDYASKGKSDGGKKETSKQDSTTKETKSTTEKPKKDEASTKSDTKNSKD
jgi:putative FmdB family regulatory protein